MNVIRWIISVPISIAILIPLYIAVEWLLGWVNKIVYFIMFWGTRYDVPPMFDFEYQVEDFKSFIFITCLSTLISAGISGYIGGKICPRKHVTATSWLFGIAILPLVIYSIVSFWNSEHWFYSTLWVIDMILFGVIFAGFAATANEED